ncbi:MAG: divergent PAP2 family protein [Anaerolineales bacterium]|nr:divergent PAP2 family protein [Anaerolineales bacterium]
MLYGLLHNPALISALVAWAIAQGAKAPVEYLRTRTWDWSLYLRAGGMPSSHTALVVAVAHGIGLTEGFGSAAFALALVVAMIVVYDATGVRRQAGLHAEVINALLRDLVAGHPLKQEELIELLGHSPLEALVGGLLGLCVAQLLAPQLPAA